MYAEAFKALINDKVTKALRDLLDVSARLCSYCRGLGALGDKMKLRALALVAAFVGLGALASCETMSAEECVAADWRSVGYQDAASGGSDRFGQRSESCAENGIVADGAAYQSGFAEGMYTFCQPQNGFDFARRGGSFSGYCPAELEGDFRYAYADGQRVHEITSQLDSARSAINTAESERRQIDEDLRDRERALAAATTDEERQRWRNAIAQLHRERRDNDRDLDEARRNVRHYERLVSDLRFDIGRRWGPW